MYDLNATPQAYLSFNNYSSPPSQTNPSGTLANASGGAVITVTLPDGSTSTPAVSNTVTGIYTATGPTSQAGRYTVNYVSSGTFGCAISDTYDVRAAASCAILSFVDAKAALNSTKPINDAELRDYIDATTRLIEDRIGPVIVRSFTETVYGSDALWLSNRPVTAITSITGVLSGAWVITASNMYLDGITGVIQLINRMCFNDEYTVVYTAGRGLTPAIMQAARVTLQHLWRSQQGNPAPRDGDAYTAPFSLPNAARELLDPYMTPAVG